MDVFRNSYEVTTFFSKYYARIVKIIDTISNIIV